MFGKGTKVKIIGNLNLAPEDTIEKKGTIIGMSKELGRNDTFLYRVSVINSNYRRNEIWYYEACEMELDFDLELPPTLDEVKKRMQVEG